jgi:tetratricopeptide (TPR) repeat protein
MNRHQWAAALLFGGMISTQSICVVAQTTDDQQSTEAQNQDITEIINEAITLFKAGDYKTSIEKFKKAYSVVEDANILFNIARCYHMLGDKDNAKEYYNRFIYYPEVSAESKARAKKYLQELKEKDSGGTTPTDESQPEPTDESGSGATDSDQLTSPETEESEDASKQSHLLEWSLIGSGAAVAVAGGIVGGIALVNHNDFESTNNLQRKKDLEDKGKVLSLVSDISLGVGIATAAAGVILFVVRNKKQKKEAASPTAVYVPSVVPGGVNMSWLLRF